MSPVNASKAAELMEPKYVIPIHIDKDSAYNGKNAEAFEYEPAIHLRPGKGTVLKR